MNKTIRLLKVHPHHGVKHPVGTLLTMNAKVVDWLVGLGVGEAVGPESSEKIIRAPSPPARRGGCAGCGRPW